METDRKTLQCPDVSHALQVGLNCFGLKLAAESWPYVLEALVTLGLPLDSCVTIVLEAKDPKRTRVRITLETAEDDPTPGGDAL